MLITSVSVANYKSFYRLPELKLGPGFNVIIGPNNAGKTALLEALSLTFPNAAHRSQATAPRPDSSPEPLSRVDLEIQVPRLELVELLADYGRPFHVAHPDGLTVEISAQQFLGSLGDQVAVRFAYRGDGNFLEAALPNYDLHGRHSILFEVPIGADGPKLASTDLHQSADNSRLPYVLAPLLRNRIYLFDAERMHISDAAINTDPVLHPSAVNLPAVLHVLLTTNPERFRRLVGLVTAVFPEIRQVTVPPVGGAARILLWSTDPKGERADLAVPLAESGTGISQILAILYVVVNSNFPRVLLIDEPQSFLHPAALRKLVEILKAHRQHQYIISTHSPLLLTTSAPTTISLLRKEEATTVVRRIDPREATDLRAVLADVGARPSDVFGADNVLWVEGATEEACFPIIWETARTVDDRVTATVILGVKQTGDFTKRNAKATIELHKRLVGAGALMPTAVGFLFDVEGRSPAELQDLRRESRELIAFIPRRMFENYLLNPTALADVMDSIEGFRPAPVTAQEVSEWIGAHRWERPYFERRVEEAEKTDERWFREGHGGHLLEQLFKDLSERRVEYDKVRYGLELTRWISQRKPEAFAEIIPLLREAMARAT